MRTQLLLKVKFSFFSNLRKIKKLTFLYHYPKFKLFNF